MQTQHFLLNGQFLVFTRTCIVLTDMIYRNKSESSSCNCPVLLLAGLDRSSGDRRSRLIVDSRAETLPEVNMEQNENEHSGNNY